MKKIISRCGIDCSKCEYREKFNCPTCHKTNGKPFWGECELAKCNINKKFHNCSECNNFPCKLLKEFAYDKEQGDDGERIRNLEKLKKDK
jgi:uncharacterized protein DUF3795